MRRKAIMVDVDGVLVAHPDAGEWSANLEHDLGISPTLLHEVFFCRHWDDVVHGRAALRDRLSARCCLVPSTDWPWLPMGGHFASWGSVAF